MIYFFSVHEYSNEVIKQMSGLLSAELKMLYGLNKSDKIRFSKLKWPRRSHQLCSETIDRRELVAAFPECFQQQQFLECQYQRQPEQQQQREQRQFGRPLILIYYSSHA